MRYHLDMNNETPALLRKRFVAYLLDLGILLLILIAFLSFSIPEIFIAFGVGGTNRLTYDALTFISLVRWIVLGVIIVVVYFSFIPALTKGQTIGKRLVGIKVVKEDGSEGNFSIYFLREIIGRILFDFTSLGVSIIVSTFLLLGKKRKTIYDTLAKTKVVEVRRN
jgi:uncharacterized RDD family membrane protein YckC